MNSLKNMLRGNVRQYGMVIALVAIVVLFQITTDGILLQAAEPHQPVHPERLDPDPGDRHGDRHHRPAHRPVGRVGGRVHRRGGRDHDDQVGHPWPLAVILCLVLGAAIGAWHGFWVAYVGIPAFIVTLASMLIFRGLTLVVLKGATVGGLPTASSRWATASCPTSARTPACRTSRWCIAALLSVFLVVLEFRKRASAIRYNFDVAPVGLFYAKLVAIVAVIMIFAYLLAQYRGLPVVGLILSC